MAFYNWLFLNQENHDLFEHGIQGVHWNPQGKDRFELIPGAPAYTFQGFKLTWNRNFVRYATSVDPMVIDYMLYSRDIKNFYLNPFAGFMANTEPYRNELARVVPVFQEANNTSNIGVLDNPRQSLDTYHAKMMELGLQKISDEMIKQLNVFLASK